ncbi:unnamed protein product [Toxocara canis]|uniref:ShKT domain-containing protein n=1 Tax=Toxocara canis TaxID=6265 RepID=A0A183UFP2_TOXCA|nr:unnamed protein product [Toxocara canis]
MINKEDKKKISANCFDRAPPGGLSNCAQNARYCTVPLYVQLMREQCPRTCGYCGVTAAPNIPNIRPGACVDLAAPGRLSTCPSQRAYCTVPAYVQLMRQQCPRTCGYCT